MKTTEMNWKQQQSTEKSEPSVAQLFFTANTLWKKCERDRWLYDMNNICKKALVCTIASIILLMLGYWVWRRHVTFFAPHMKHLGSCEKHEIPFQKNTVKVVGEIMVQPDLDYVEAMISKFPNTRRKWVRRSTLGLSETRWRYTYWHFCPECEKLGATWWRTKR